MDFARLSAEQRSSLERATAKYEAALEGSPATSYLEDRGITKEAASTFRLGYVSEPEVGHEQSQGRLAIPYVTPGGVVDIRFRALDDSEPKYLGTNGSTTHLYNVRDLHSNSSVLVLCEGEMDTVVLSGVVGLPAVGVPGVSNWKKHFRHCFADFERVLIVFDNDEGKAKNYGQEAAKKIRQDLPNGVIIAPPKGLDINDWYLAEGADSIRKALVPSLCASDAP